METLTREQIKQQVALMVNACSIDCQPEACLCQQIENAALSYIDDAMQFAMMFGTAEVERNGYAEWKLLGIDRRKPQLILPDGAIERAEKEGLAKDAERYRTLQNIHRVASSPDGSHTFFIYSHCESLDAAIDYIKLTMREAEKPTAKAGNSVASKESGRPSDFPHRTPEEIEQIGSNNRDWAEDFTQENGRYQNKCMYCERLFLGHKRRVVCKVCASLVVLASRASDLERTARALAGALEQWEKWTAVGRSKTPVKETRAALAAWRTLMERK